MKLFQRSASAIETMLSVLAWIGISFLTVLWTGLMGIIYLVHALVDPSRRIIHGIAGLWGRGLVASAAGTRVTVEGLENIPKDRPVIFMANHQSYVDVPLLYFIRRNFKWMADADLFRIPVFGWAMWMSGYIPVWRGNAREGIRALQKAEGWLKRGVSIFLFPEGTRSHTGVLGRFQTGGFRLAATTGVPIVPVLVVGTRFLLPRGTWIFRMGIQLKIRVLPPVVVAQSASRAAEMHRLANQVRSQMAAAYEQELKRYRSDGDHATMGPEMK